MIESDGVATGSGLSYVSIHEHVQNRKAAQIMLFKQLFSLLRKNARYDCTIIAQ